MKPLGLEKEFDLKQGFFSFHANFNALILFFLEIK